MGDDSARRLILARRARFVAAALASVTAAAVAGTSVNACGGELDPTESDTGGGGTAGDRDAQASDGADGASKDATPQPCLSPRKPDDPQPCLTPPADDDDDFDAGPMPCLKFAPDPADR
ncbi:MAG: hypothetical protein BGO98_45505 [Myxococcales bacterium 68-20]|nr:hypothetical protein [Myxococcales bacterium]OJY31139.1 MAG: hypothetical protein BGO98_45505 [Myxococcales bacterium 68-20]